MKVIIFHGWGSTSEDNWFPWLAAELKKTHIKVLLPDLPNSQHPKEKDWINTALHLTKYDDETVLVGHSLGCVLIMRLLERLGKKIKAAFLVSGFDNDLGIPELKSFFERDFYYQLIKDNAGKIVMLNSDDDPSISMEVAERLAKNLDCQLIVYKNKGHLSGGTGDMRFPELLEMILNEDNKNK
jgi:hypothetical protein